MRRELRYYLLIIILSFLPLISIFSTDKLFHTHDGYAHLPRIAAYVKALKDGEFPVRWAGDLNYGYGMPIFNFMYPLPYFIASGFVFLGSTLANAFRFTLAISYVLAGIGMLGFTFAFFRDYKKAILATIVYQFASFRFVEFMVRGDIGEVYTYAFLPFLLWAIVTNFKSQKYKNLFFTAIFSALLILSHNSLSLLFFGLAFVFVILFSPSKKSLLFSLISMGIGLCLSLFYWFPALMEDKYTYGELFMRHRFMDYFPPLQNFFIPNFTYDPRFMTKGINVQFGIIQILSIIAGIVVLTKNKINFQVKKLVVFNLGLIVVCLFIMQPVSTEIWTHVALLRQFQFPWRFLGVVVIATSLLSVTLLSFRIFRNNFIFISLIILILTLSFGFWHPPLGYEKINEQFWWNYPLTSTYFGETDLIWSAGPAKAYPRQRVEVISGKGNITSFRKKTTLQTFKVNAKTDMRLVSNTQFFPGWRVFINNREVPIQFQDQNWRGLITFNVPKGEDSVKIIFGETKLRLLADYISLITIIILMGYGVYSILKTKVSLND